MRQPLLLACPATEANPSVLDLLYILLVQTCRSWYAPNLMAGHHSRDAKTQYVVLQAIVEHDPVAQVNQWGR